MSYAPIYDINEWFTPGTKDIGILFLDGDNVKIKTNENIVFNIGSLNDMNDSFRVVVAKIKLVEKNETLYNKP